MTRIQNHLTKHIPLKDTTARQNKRIYNSAKSLGISFDIVDFIMAYCPNSLNYFNVFNFVILYKLLYICKVISFNSAMSSFPSTSLQYVSQKTGASIRTEASLAMTACPVTLNLIERLAHLKRSFHEEYGKDISQLVIH